MEALGIAPRKSYGDSLRNSSWNIFYHKLMKRDEGAFNLVIDTFDGLIESVFNEDKSNKRIGELVRESISDSYGVKKSDIQDHLFKYLWLNDYKGNDFLCAVGDISRCLKRIRDDEAAYLLPHEDKELTLGFLERLSRPPIKKGTGTGW